MKANKMDQAIDKWHTEENDLYRFYQVEQTNGKINAITWHGYNGEKVRISNYDIRAILKIIKQGDYKLE